MLTNDELMEVLGRNGRVPFRVHLQAGVWKLEIHGETFEINEVQADAMWRAHLKNKPN